MTVQFSEPMNPATIDGSTLRLRAQGASVDVPATVSYAGLTATLDPTDPLAPNAQYHVTVSGSVEDANGNALGTDESWSFTTAPLTLGLIDTTSADFGAGTTGAETYVSQTADGEVTLTPAVGAEFSGVNLPSGWSAFPWADGGAATLAGGKLIVDGARVGTDATYPAGGSLEYVATFATTTFQHIGFGNDFNDQPWAIFSTKADGSFNARTNRLERDRHAAAEQPARVARPLPHRLERGQRRVLRRRRPGRHARRELRGHADAPARQRRGSRRRDARDRLAAHEPVSGFGHVPRAPSTPAAQPNGGRSRGPPTLPLAQPST